MAIFLSKTIDFNTKWAIWRIEEDESFFQNQLFFFEHESDEFVQIKGSRRRLEWLAARLILHQLSGENERLPIEKDAFGKPFWPDRPSRFFSLSHSAGMVAALISDRPCGLDIQIFTEKMERIAPRFLTENEADFSNNLSWKHFVWSAKEAIYKAYGLKALDFKKHIEVDENGFGWLKKTDFQAEFALFSEKIESAGSIFMLAGAIEK